MLLHDRLRFPLHTDGNVYYVYNGVLVPGYVGFYFHSDGKLYYVVNSVFDSTYNGTATYNGNRYEIVNGIAQP